MCEALDPVFHEHVPRGGRVNLRNLANDLDVLAGELRQHQLQQLPPIGRGLTARLLAEKPLEVRGACVVCRG